MCLDYSMKSKSYICFNHRTKTIVECTNVKFDIKFGIKEKMKDYNSDEDDNTRIFRQNVEVFFQTNNDLLNDV